MFNNIKLYFIHILRCFVFKVNMKKYFIDTTIFMFELYIIPIVPIYLFMYRCIYIYNKYICAQV